ncbi:hypothetical protein B0T26DRAFT_650702, partial [Lasiosphaeria miniovina]
REATEQKGKETKRKKEHSTRDSLVVTHPATGLAAVGRSGAVRGLSMGERTGFRIFHYLWPYVLVVHVVAVY